MTATMTRWLSIKQKCVGWRSSLTGLDNRDAGHLY
jgi:hypothetical protein